MKSIFGLILLFSAFQVSFAQTTFKVYASRFGKEMPEEFATEIRVYEELGPNKWHCVVYDVLTKYRLEEYDCISILPDTVVGVAKHYWKGDALVMEAEVDKSIFNGAYKTFYINGQVEAEGQYENGIKTGQWKFYYPNGVLLGRVTYRNGEKLQWQYFEPDGKMIKRPYEDEAPQFPGGPSKLREYLSATPYPPVMKEKNMSGIVEVAFTIDSTGKAHSPYVRFSTDSTFAKAALKAIEDMPLWRPGYHHSRKVNTLQSLAFYFRRTRENEFSSLSRDLQNSGLEAFTAGDFEKAYLYFKEASYLNAYNNQNILYWAIAAINLKKIDEACKCSEYLYFKQGVAEAWNYLHYCDGLRFSGMPVPIETYIVLP